MSLASLSYRIYPLGDAAITIEFGTAINSTINNEVVARFHQLKQDLFRGVIEIIPAYTTLTVCYDINRVKKEYPSANTVFETVKKIVEEKLQLPVQPIAVDERIVKIPVCYDEEFAVDIQALAVAKNISVEEVINIHTSKNYKVYMLGFLPGFAYMGEVDERIIMPRKIQPVPIAEGSVGIAGVQTGIYPFASPGGWQIIGRTPLKLFNVGRDEPVLLRAGDTVQFYSISKEDFTKQENDSLF
jgi:inhibitor of KinA